MSATGFPNQVAAITGAGSGIGRALAIHLAKEGCHLALSDINPEQLDETAKQLADTDRTITTHVLDVANKDAVYAYAEEVIASHGKANIIINNAGVALVDTVEEMSYDDFEWLMDINFWGVVYGTKAFLPHLKAQPTGHIVNISSLFGLISVPSQSAYNASKFAVRGFTEALRQELLDTQVSVSCVHPGGIKTNIVRSGRFRNSHGRPTNHDKLTKEFDQKMARTTPEQAAAIIVNGMKRKHPRILVGKDAIWIDRLQRLMPAGYQKHVAKASK